ncbi:MAG: RNA-binding S4 domain-containing protein [Gammaproteobacteria bacterium]|nr:RNA-binding S4 domain-containing protein [Gammaproteobacteria bacterium]
MRLDKYLKVSQIIKRRSVAKEAAQNERIRINSKDSKPSSQVKEGDIIEISYSSKKLCIKVLSTNEYTSKKDAPSMYEVIENK